MISIEMTYLKKDLYKMEISFPVALRALWKEN